MDTRFGKTLRALPNEINEYLPQKYLLFKEGSGKYIVAMQPLQEAIWSDKLYQQSFRFLKKMESLNGLHSSNIMQDAEGNLKLIDFSQTAIMKGTPFYAAEKRDRQAMARPKHSLDFAKQSISEFEVFRTNQSIPESTRN